MSWESEFDDPLTLPNRGQALTLREAGQYILTLSSTETLKPNWQNAIRMLLEAAESGLPMAYAFNGIQQALRASQAAELEFKPANGVSGDTVQPDTNHRDIELLLSLIAKIRGLIADGSPVGNRIEMIRCALDSSHLNTTIQRLERAIQNRAPSIGPPRPN